MFIRRSTWLTDAQQALATFDSMPPRFAVWRHGWPSYRKKTGAILWGAHRTVLFSSIKSDQCGHIGDSTNFKRSSNRSGSRVVKPRHHQRRDAVDPLGVVLLRRLSFIGGILLDPEIARHPPQHRVTVVRRLGAEHEFFAAALTDPGYSP